MKEFDYQKMAEELLDLNARLSGLMTLEAVQHAVRIADRIATLEAMLIERGFDIDGNNVTSKGE